MCLLRRKKKRLPILHWTKWNDRCTGTMFVFLKAFSFGRALIHVSTTNRKRTQTVFRHLKWGLKSPRSGIQLSFNVFLYSRWSLRKKYVSWISNKQIQHFNSTTVNILEFDLLVKPTLLTYVQRFWLNFFSFSCVKENAELFWLTPHWCHLTTFHLTRS